MRTLSILFATAAVLHAQGDPAKQLTAKSFLPPDHEYVCWVDLKAMRDRGIWEELDRSLLSVAFREIEKDGGVKLPTLDRATMLAVVDAEGDLQGAKQLALLEASAPLVMPDYANPEGGRGWAEEQIGSHSCRVRRNFRGLEEVLVLPTPQLRVAGARELVEPVLTGKPWNGKPSADVLSLLSGRGDNLACMVMSLRVEKARAVTLGRLLGDMQWPEADPPTFVMLRVLATGEADDPQLEVQAVVRHRKGEAGLEQTEKAVREWLEGLKKHPRLGALKPTWNKVQLSRSGTDLVARIELGRARNAVGTLAQLMAPLMPQQPTLEDVTEAPPPASEPAPAPKGGEGKGGGERP